MRIQNRLRSTGDIRRVLGAGRRAVRPTVTGVALLEEPGDEISREPRIAVVAGRRVGEAVVRNRIKRRIRAAARPLLPAVSPGARIVLIATPRSAAASFQELADDIGAVVRTLSEVSA